jgi:hypothetical protein
MKELDQSHLLLVVTYVMFLMVWSIISSINFFCLASIIAVSIISCGLYMYGFGFAWDLFNLSLGTTLSLLLGVHLSMLF